MKNIKKFILLFFLLCLLSIISNAQQLSVSFTFTTVSQAATSAINVTSTGLSFYKMIWVRTGSVTAGTIAVDSSSDGVSFSAGGVIAGQVVSGSDSSFMTASAVFTNFFRVNPNASITGTGTVTLTILGFVNNPGSGSSANVTVVGPLGSQTSANSVSVALASDQTALNTTSITGIRGTPIMGSDATNFEWLGTDTSGRILTGASAAPGADAAATSTQARNGASTGGPFQTAGYGFNGSTWDKLRNTSLTNFPTSQTSTARNEIGTLTTEKNSRFGTFSNPAASSQASIVWAAEASVRHVADCVSFSAAATTAPALTALTINLRDGASGAGTILHTWEVAIPATTGTLVSPFSVCGLNLVGTTNTAMTLEFSALLTNLIESVSLTGYNVN